MKSAVRTIYRTAGDTDPIALRISVRTGDQTDPVPDEAEVTLVIADETPILVTGLAAGNDSGEFVFDGNDLAELPAGSHAYVVQVEDAGILYTCLRGTIEVDTTIEVA